MVLSITWGAVVKIAILIGLGSFAMNFVKCLHDRFCILCKKDACCK